MEEIKSSFERMMDQFNESVTHSAPKRLSFSFLCDSITESATKKRRLSATCDDSPEVNSNNNGSSNNSMSLSTAMPTSPWEMRRMKADILEANARATKLQKEIDRLHKIRNEMEILYDSKVTELKKQCTFSSQKVLDLEKHMTNLRKREHAAKQESIRLEKTLNETKYNSENEIRKLQREKMDAEENLHLVQSSLNDELNMYKRHAEKLEMELELTTEEFDNTKTQLTEVRERAELYDDLKLKCEQLENDLATAISNNKQLEFEKANYDDWKEITKNTQARLLNISDMDKEMDRLKANNKHLQELIGNKLLLEEQVHDLKTRLEREEGARTEAVTLHVKLTHVEQELKEWVKVAQDHCLPNMLVSPMALRSRLEQLLQNDIIMASEKKSNMSETKTIEFELLDWKHKCEILNKNIEELNIALKRHKTFKERVQKKLLFVSRERDCYKQLVENFEKDLTVSSINHAESSNIIEVQLRSRLEVLEKTLVGYKDMCASLEAELANAKQIPLEEQAVDNPLNSETYEHIKKELDLLRLDNEKLRRRKEELELELEHRCLKGDFNKVNTKIVHLIQNPAAEAYENSKNLIEKLQAEIERLKRRNQKLEEDSETTQSQLNETNMTLNIKELNQLRAELDSNNAKMRKLKECYKTASMELREVCYMLFGYRIDRVGLKANFKISSMYAESPDDYLNFRLNESNRLDMLETPYSVTLKPLMDSQLMGNNSLPAFLSSLTLELFNRSTITIS